MTIWRRLAQVQVLPAPIAIRPIDDFNGSASIGHIDVALDRQDGARWVPMNVQAIRTASGLIAYPGLGKVGDPATAPIERYRVRLVDPDEHRVYQPAYRYTLDGLEFDVSPWNDSVPPAVVPDRPETVFLYPGTNYPFPHSVAVLRGRTIDAGGAPLADARIATGLDHVLSDERGAFSLPIRLPIRLARPLPVNPFVIVIAEHARTGVGATVLIALPAGLAVGIELQLV
jgi:hypothetical protein